MDPPSFLDEDVIKVSGQNYVLLSIVSATSNQKHTLPAHNIGIKIRGCFGSKEEADHHVKRLQKTDPHFDVFVAETGKWLLLPPDMDKIDDQRYQEAYLTELISGHRDNQLQAKQMFEERKMAIMEKGLDSVLTPEERLPPPADGAMPAPVDWVPSGSSGSNTHA